MTRLIYTLLILLILLVPIASQSDEQDYRVSLVTTGPGSEVYLWWGHSAIMVENLANGDARFYDFGVFSFETENFFLNFLFGRLWYMAYSSPAQWSLQRMVNNDRTILIQELHFSPGRKLELVHELQWQVQPDNREYLYDYYRDNCATRIRDLLNDAYTGALYQVSGDVPSLTIREQTRRFTGRNMLVEWGLMFMMSGVIDMPATAWEAMFLPAEIPRYLEQVTIAEGPDAGLPAIAGGEYLHHGEEKHNVPALPGSPYPVPATAGVLAAVLLILGRRLSGPAGWLPLFFFRIMLAVSALLGTILFFFAFFTDHSVTYGNWNLLLLNPLHWLTLFAPYKIPDRPRSWRLLLLFFPWVLTIDLSLILMITRLFGIPGQAVGEIIAFLLPLALGVAGPWIFRVLKPLERAGIVNNP